MAVTVACSRELNGTRDFTCFIVLASQASTPKGRSAAQVDANGRRLDGLEKSARVNLQSSHSGGGGAERVFVRGGSTIY